MEARLPRRTARRGTYDLDVVYKRSPANMQRLAAALQPLQPYLRGAPPGLPFKFDYRTLAQGLNFTLTTSLGAINLLGEIAGGGNFENLIDQCLLVEVYGSPCWCLALEPLIATKRAAGRQKDLETIAELEAIADQDDEPISPSQTPAR